MITELGIDNKKRDVMLHKVTYDENAKIITIKYWGNITLPELQRGSKDAAQKIIEHKCNHILVDSREIDFQLSTLEIYDLPETFSSILSEFGLELRKIKRALLVDKLEDDYRFVETVAVNRGYRVKLFEDVNEARKWLSNS